MARIIGNLKPEDDGLHELGPEPNFNESMYFNFFDREKSIGGFIRLGNRANEGQAEMTVCLYLADGRVLFSFKRAQISHNDAFDAGGLRFEVLNCGVPGYTSIESLVNLELRLLELDPDVVLIYHGINDARMVQGRGWRADYTHVRRSWRDPREQVSPLSRWLVDRVRTWAWTCSARE